ncbi:hypothetical protein ABE47_22810 [Bacillus thuringiensis]|uniref:Transposase n=1 Tax=Bacillus thuringiensis YBT-1518 TaxID=529122 RepID=A0A9W3PJL1_BACTU|nr:transposase [Bacillus thuringiensis YBT-1518]MBG9486518.1 hypothetical protein [Bacillus thuringiensis]MBG9491875.1 hypothetical protein [Bacillus thuringiensis]MBG9500097.1 hypothetical protein [Bacillus thuringiensis]MBG9509826.1 hypothetical protein [Bacillus thuringiensis]
MTKENLSNYKTLQIWIKKGHRMYSYFQECCHNAKNMYNTTNFYIRQVYTGLTQGKELQPLQKEVLDYIHKNIGKMNDTQYIHFVFFFHSSEWWCKWENNVLLPVPTKNLLRMLP